MLQDLDRLILQQVYDAVLNRIEISNDQIREQVKGQDVMQPTVGSEALLRSEVVDVLLGRDDWVRIPPPALPGSGHAGRGQIGPPLSPAHPSSPCF